MSVWGDDRGLLTTRHHKGELIPSQVQGRTEAAHGEWDVNVEQGAYKMSIVGFLFCFEVLRMLCIYRTYASYGSSANLFGISVLHFASQPKSVYSYGIREGTPPATTLSSDFVESSM